LFTNLVDRVLEDVTWTLGETCETQFPSENVAAESGLNYYANQDTESEGIYYQPTSPVHTTAGDGNGQRNIDEVNPVDITPDINDPVPQTNIVNSAVLDAFPSTTDYEAVDTTTRPSDTVAYVLTLTSCPGTYEPLVSEVTDPKEDFFEATAMIKQSVCKITELEATSEIRKRNLRNRARVTEEVVIEDVEPFTMYALVHPEAIHCPDGSGDVGSTYDRVSLLKAQGYHIEIVGQPITDDILNATQPFIAEHIEEDVGVRDSMTLHAFNLEEHKAVVVMDYNTQLQLPVQEEIDDLVADPNKQVKYVKDKDGGVSKSGFMIIKPSKAKFEEIREEYINTPYDQVTGWNGEGHNTFNGKMGLKGFFSYKVTKDSSWEELDRCTYNNQLDVDCISQIDVNDSKVVRHSKSVCGEPRDCPYDHPNWSSEKIQACQKAHADYFMGRYEFEQRYLVKTIIQDRIGQFKPQSFIGYCTGPGKKNYLGLTDQIYPKPDWQIICPPIECPFGSYMKNDCTCTEPSDDPCDACPSNTRCQLYPELRCVDCSCGFCDNTGASCCEFNGVDSCQQGSSDTSCGAGSLFFPTFNSVDICSNDVNLFDTKVPEGCGCKPNSYIPCSYNRELQGTYDDQCHICTVNDLVSGSCLSCLQCIDICTNSCFTSNHGTTVDTYDKYISCLSDMDQSCHSSCMDSCKKF